jgi:hypothetical protein
MVRWERTKKYIHERRTKNDTHGTRRTRTAVGFLEAGELLEDGGEDAETGQEADDADALREGRRLAGTRRAQAVAPPLGPVALGQREREGLALLLLAVRRRERRVHEARERQRRRQIGEAELLDRLVQLALLFGRLLPLAQLSRVETRSGAGSGGRCGRQAPLGRGSQASAGGLDCGGC